MIWLASLSVISPMFSMAYLCLLFTTLFIVNALEWPQPMSEGGGVVHCHLIVTLWKEEVSTCGRQVNLMIRAETAY